jgi:hypothetical protein
MPVEYLLGTFETDSMLHGRILRLKRRWPEELSPQKLKQISPY